MVVLHSSVDQLDRVYLSSSAVARRLTRSKQRGVGDLTSSSPNIALTANLSCVSR